eukprot:4027396-Pyramimonas_sp.AAC.1
MWGKIQHPNLALFRRGVELDAVGAHPPPRAYGAPKSTSEASRPWPSKFSNIARPGALRSGPKVRYNPGPGRLVQLPVDVGGGQEERPRVDRVHGRADRRARVAHVQLELGGQRALAGALA